MVAQVFIRRNEYYDSIFLMRIAQNLMAQKGIVQAILLMGTEKNKELLQDVGFRNLEIATASSNDLIVAIKAEKEDILKEVTHHFERWLQPPKEKTLLVTQKSLAVALRQKPQANLAVISIPGAYAAKEAQKALENGLHVFLFSSNIPIEEELFLKNYARQHGLLVMGPDCGTAIIGGIGLGFANAVRRGSIGVIGASGTGIQEFTSLIHQGGLGISQAIGVGSRDLSDTIGGISTQVALDALIADEKTKIIGLISKPPGRRTTSMLLPQIGQSPKPIITCFLGGGKIISSEMPHLYTASTIDEAAAVAIQIATGQSQGPLKCYSPEFLELFEKEIAALQPEQKYIRGLFAGGTFCYQAQQIFKEAGVRVFSNAPLEANQELADSQQSQGHTFIDMGAEEFTEGRAHPMIDARWRQKRILTEAQDPQIAVLLLDIILGYNSSPDPAGDLVPAIAAAKKEAQKRGHHLCVVASVCGTENDPQNLISQVNTLEQAGVITFRSSAQAARFCAQIALRQQERFNEGKD